VRLPATRRPAWALLFALLLLRALVPAGFMFSAAASGAPALVLCPGVEAPPPPVHEMAMHRPAHRHGHDPASHPESPCPFAALASPALPPAPLAVAPAAAARSYVSLEAAPSAAAALGLAAPPPPATGPPASA
jgi:hypothetical protein